MLVQAQQSEEFSHEYMNETQGVQNAYTCNSQFKDQQRNKFGLINFSKPVSKLVSDVAQAIGESARKMQPRSQQRSAIAQRQDLAVCNSVTNITKQ